MHRTAQARRSAHSSQRGITLIETTITLLVAMVALGSAVPSLKEARLKRHLDGAAAQLATDLRHARGLAVAQRQNVRFSLQQPGSGSCYVVHTGPAGACSCDEQGASVCQPGAQALLSAGFPASGPVRLSASAHNLTIESDRGTFTPTTTLRAHTSDGRSVHQVVNLMGRVRACSPDGAASGYPAC
jgi:type IV fimbrial biogenesis protein FimT